MNQKAMGNIGDLGDDPEDEILIFIEKRYREA
jgi:hypothetical protein